MAPGARGRSRCARVGDRPEGAPSRHAVQALAPARDPALGSAWGPAVGCRGWAGSIGSSLARPGSLRARLQACARAGRMRYLPGSRQREYSPGSASRCACGSGQLGVVAPVVAKAAPTAARMLCSSAPATVGRRGLEGAAPAASSALFGELPVAGVHRPWRRRNPAGRGPLRGCVDNYPNFQAGCQAELRMGHPRSTAAAGVLDAWLAAQMRPFSRRRPRPDSGMIVRLSSG